MSSVQNKSPRFGNVSSSLATTVTSHIHPPHEHVSSSFFPDSFKEAAKSFDAEFGPIPTSTPSQTKVSTTYVPNPSAQIPMSTQTPDGVVRHNAYTTIQPTTIQQDALTTLHPKGTTFPGTSMFSHPMTQQAPPPPYTPQNYTIPQQAPPPPYTLHQEAPPPYTPQNYTIPQQAPPPYTQSHIPIQTYVPGYITKSSFMKKNRLNLTNESFANGAFSPGKKSKVAIITKDVAAVGGPAALAGGLLGTQIGVIGSVGAGGMDLGITGPVLGIIGGIVGGVGAIWKSGFDINRNKKAFEEELARVKDAVLASGKLGVVKGSWKFSASRAARKANDEIAQEINRDLNQGIENKVYRIKLPNGVNTVSIYIRGAREAQKYLARTNT